MLHKAQASRITRMAIEIVKAFASTCLIITYPLTTAIQMAKVSSCPNYKTPNSFNTVTIGLVNSSIWVISRRAAFEGTIWTKPLWACLCFTESYANFPRRIT
mmetsp:Transcript_32694/g.47994  ORF Transcript_32694/g.47994 Transcript_32694/m.47994 type:complete len:102 (+) Transcript_32694:219-524(+)